MLLAFDVVVDKDAQQMVLVFSFLSMTSLIPIFLLSFSCLFLSFPLHPIYIYICICIYIYIYILYPSLDLMFISLCDHVSFMHVNVALIYGTNIPSYPHSLVPSYPRTLIPSYPRTLVLVPSYPHTLIPSYLRTCVSRY